MKSRVRYNPRWTRTWFVETKDGLFKKWEHVESFDTKEEAIKLATAMLSAGVVWSSDTSEKPNEQIRL